jgi:L-alanine-DL-glutamate epimerase-like enolase superfamily enzyme
MSSEARITSSRLRVFTISTDAPEADGTFAWGRTTLVMAEICSGTTKGLGYTYADTATARVVSTLLDDVVKGRDAFDHGAIVQDMYRRIRNLGTTGIGMMAISAIDDALWDLRARLADLPLVSLLGRLREDIALYGSGGFTSYDDEQLQDQLGRWADHDSGW